MRFALASVLVLAACGSLSGAASPSATPLPTPTPVPGTPVAVVPWADIAAPSHPRPTPPVPPPGVPRCGASDLRYRFDALVPSNGNPMTPPAAGLVAIVAATRACWVQGSLRASLFDAAGTELPTVASPMTYESGTGPEFHTIYLVAPGAFAAAADTFRPDQVYVWFGWSNWCDRRRPASLDLLFADGSRSPRIAIVAARADGTPTALPGCADAGVPSTTFAMFDASHGFPPPTAPPAWVPPVSFDVELDRPLSAAPGAVLRYAAVLTNRSASTVRIDRCPIVRQEIPSAEHVSRRTLLNCQGTPAIPPGRSIVFEMELPLPSTIRSGPKTLVWTLGSEGLAGNYSAAMKVALTVVAP